MFFVAKTILRRRRGEFCCFCMTVGKCRPVQNLMKNSNLPADAGAAGYTPHGNSARGVRFGSIIAHRAVGCAWGNITYSNVKNHDFSSKMMFFWLKRRAAGAPGGLINS